MGRSKRRKGITNKAGNKKKRKKSQEQEQEREKKINAPTQASIKKILKLMKRYERMFILKSMSSGIKLTLENSEIVFDNAGLLVRAFSLSDFTAYPTNLQHREMEFLQNERLLCFTNFTKEEMLSKLQGNIYHSMRWNEWRTINKASRTVVLKAGPLLGCSAYPCDLLTIGMPIFVDNDVIILQEDFELCKEGDPLCLVKHVVLKSIIVPVPSGSDIVSVMAMWEKGAGWTEYTEKDESLDHLQSLDRKIYGPRYYIGRKRRKNKKVNQSLSTVTADYQSSSTLNADVKLLSKLNAHDQSSSMVKADEQSSSMVKADDQSSLTLNADVKLLSKLNAHDQPSSMLNAGDQSSSMVKAEDQSSSMLNADDQTSSTLNADGQLPSTLNADDQLSSMLNAGDQLSSMVNTDGQLSSMLNADEQLSPTSVCDYPPFSPAADGLEVIDEDM